MNPREQKSLAHQIVRCYGQNRKAARPLHLHLSGLADATQNHPDVLPANGHWRSWAEITLVQEPAEECWPEPLADGGGDVFADMERVESAAAGGSAQLGASGLGASGRAYGSSGSPVGGSAAGAGRPRALLVRAAWCGRGVCRCGVVCGLAPRACAVPGRRRWSR